MAGANGENSTEERMMMMRKKKRFPVGGVSADIENQKNRKKERQKEEFDRMYNDLEEIVFTDGDNFNEEQMESFLNDFRVIPKNIFSYGLSKSALAVYPVLCSRADFEEEDKTFQISQENIAKLAGVSENSVRKATTELEETGLLSREKKTEGTRHFYVYRVAFIRKSLLEEHKGNTIYFYTCIIKNGIWAKLNPRAKALYLAMRATARQDLEEYNYIEEGEHYRPMEHDEYIRNRKWDICLLSLAEMSRKAGIERSNIDTVLVELEKYKLIEQVGKWTKVFLKPTRLLKY